MKTLKKHNERHFVKYMQIYFFLVYSKGREVAKGMATLSARDG